MAKGVTVLLNIFVESPELETVTRQLEQVPELIDLYEVTGEHDLVALIEMDSISAFMKVLKDKILPIKGVRSTVSSIVTHTHKK